VRDGDGVPEGPYKVLVVPATPPNPERPPPGWPPINLRFGSPRNSPLEFTVKPGTNEMSITVEK
jgi:hypothetical protein